MSDHGSQAIHRALAILRCFTSEHPTLALKDIAEATGLTSPTAHRMVKALETDGFLVRSAARGVYTLGPAVMDLAQVVLSRSDHSDLVAASWPYLERIRGLTGETVGLQVPLGSMRLCLAELQSHHPMRLARGVGHISPLHAGAAGKALLAWLPREQRDALLAATPLRRLTPHTMVDPAALEPELAAVRRRGYALSVSEVVTGANGLAVPILGPGELARAVVNVTGPASRWTSARMRDAAAPVREVITALEAAVRRPDVAQSSATCPACGLGCSQSML